MNKTERDFIADIRERVEKQKVEVIEEQKGMAKEDAFLEGEYMLRKMMKETRPGSPMEVERLINETMMDIMKYFQMVGLDIAPEEFVSYIKEKANV